MISVSNYVVITILNFFKFSITAMFLIVLTDVIIIDPIVQEEIAILFLIDKMISDMNYMVIISLNCTRENGNVLII